MDDRWIIYFTCWALIKAIGSTLELSYRPELRKIGSFANFANFASFLMCLPVFFYFNWVHAILVTCSISAAGFLAQSLLKKCANFLSKFNWFSRNWSSDLKPIVSSAAKLIDYKFQFENFSLQFKSTINDDDPIPEPDALTFNSEKRWPWKKAKWFDRRHKIFGIPSKNIIGLIRIDAYFLQFQGGGLTAENGFSKFISQYLYANYFAPPELSEHREESMNSYEICYDFLSSRHCQASFICTMNKGIPEHLLFYMCSDEQILLIEGSYSCDTPPAENLGKEFLETFFSSVKVTNSLTHQPNATFQATDVDVNPPEPFAYHLPSRIDFENFFCKHAEDPVRWEIFQHSPNYMGWMNAQYSAHRSIYKRLLNDYHNHCLENFRV